MLAPIKQAKLADKTSHPRMALSLDEPDPKVKAGTGPCSRAYSAQVEAI
jgi:hypothetical protein